MTTQDQFPNEPCFVISVAARIIGVHAQTLRYYERVGLVWPSRTGGRQRLYSMADIERLKRIKALTEDMGVNLAGAEVALELMMRIEDLEKDVKQLTEQVHTLRARATTPTGGPPTGRKSTTGKKRCHRHRC